MPLRYLSEAIAHHERSILSSLAKGGRKGNRSGSYGKKQELQKDRGSEKGSGQVLHKTGWDTVKFLLAMV